MLTRGTAVGSACLSPKLSSFLIGLDGGREAEVLRLSVGAFLEMFAYAWWIGGEITLTCDWYSGISLVALRATSYIPVD